MEDNLSSTPYDDSFRTLLIDCSHLILPVLNEAFGEHYTGHEKVVFSQNEHFLKRKSGARRKRITDSSFYVIKGDKKKCYHTEIQATDDSRILLRMMEYDMAIADESADVIGNEITISYPHSAVIFLRRTNSTPDELTVRIKTPGGDVTYPVAVLNMQDYGIDDIFEKKLYFLIPFYIFTHEKRFAEYEADKEKLAGLTGEYEEILSRLDALVESGEMDEYTKEDIVALTKNVLEAIAKKHKRVRKGVAKVMGGRYIVTEPTRILNRGIRRGLEEGRVEGRAEGREEGRAEGREEGRAEGRIAGRADAIMENIKSLMRRLKMTASEAMEALDIPIDQRGKYMAALS